MRTSTRLAIMLVLLVAARAEARPVRFLGPHPIAARHGHGYCYIEAPHIHDYAPDHVALYQQVDGAYVFTGDPTPFGYDGERHPWQGHHPVLVEGASEPVYCVIDGPHFHAYAAPSSPEFAVHDGVAVYVAPIPPVYVPQHRVRVVNAEYRPLLVASRPGVTVEVDAPGLVVGAPPSVVVEAPHPVFVPPAVVVEPPHPVFVAPGPVVVGAPGPVVVGAPGPVFVGGREHDGWGHREHEHGGEGWGRGHGEHEGRGWEHHDNGRHNGWRK